MTPNDPLTGLLFLLVGAAIIYLFQVRRRALGELRAEQFPELNEDEYKELVVLLKTAYERMLYMGVFFLPLAFSTWHGTGRLATIFFLLLIGLLFLSNIFPRNKIMRLLEKNELSIEVLKQRNITI